MAEQQQMGNPAVVGLAGFGLTTMVLQFHNVGWCGLGPVLALALAFGGAAQLIAGFQEFKCGNNFGYSAFVSYGAFWVALSVILLLNHFGIYKSSGTDIGYFLVVWDFIRHAKECQIPVGPGRGSAAGSVVASWPHATSNSAAEPIRSFFT